jgi:hypothetical protein
VSEIDQSTPVIDGASAGWVARRPTMAADPRSPASERAVCEAKERQLAELQQACWQRSNEVAALQATIEVLRHGANTLAVDNAILRIENEDLRRSVRTARPKHR